MKNIIKLEEWKQYEYYDQTKYFYKIHELQDKNLNITLDSDKKTIYIYGYNGEIINENGDIIYPNYIDYLNKIIDNSYNCHFIK